MWLTKLVLNPASRAARRDLANPYEMHRTLSKAVSRALEEGRERLLWRLEPARGLEPPVVLVQTLTEPDWSVLDEGYAQVFPPKPFHPALKPGQRLRFRLRANPAKRLAATGKRVALKTPAEKVAWLERRLEEGGFRLLEGKGAPGCRSSKTPSWRSGGRRTGRRRGSSSRCRRCSLRGASGWWTPKGPSPR